MQVILPIHMSLWQQLLHTVPAVIFLAVCLIILVFIFVTCMVISGEDSVKKQIYAIIGVFLSTFGMLIIGASLFCPSVHPNPRQNTTYRATNTKTNVYWGHDSNTSKHFSYYQDDYLFLKGTTVKLAKTQWSNKEQIITPLNSSGKAWMIVAKKLEEQPKPQANLKMDVHLSYTKGSVETPQGTKQFICYVNNKKIKQNSNYTTLTYK